MPPEFNPTPRLAASPRRSFALGIGVDLNRVSTQSNAATARTNRPASSPGGSSCRGWHAGRRRGAVAFHDARKFCLRPSPGPEPAPLSGSTARH